MAGGVTCRASLPQEADLAAHVASTDRRSSPRIQPILVGHAVDLATAQAPSTTTARSCASFERQAPTRADDQPVVDTVRATTPTPAVLAVWLLAASARLTNSPGSDTADAERPDSGCRIPRCPDAQLDTGHRTPDAHTGQRTPGRLDAHTGHWTPVAWTSPAWTLDAYTGQRTPDSGHRTLAEDADTVT
jgi:hypothetical protein